MQLDFNLWQLLLNGVTVLVAFVALRQSTRKEDTKEAQAQMMMLIKLSLAEAKAEIIGSVNASLTVYARNDVINSRLDGLEHRVTHTNDMIASILQSFMEEHKAVMKHMREEAD